MATPATHQAFRRTELHNSVVLEKPFYMYRLRDFLAGGHSRPENYNRTKLRIVKNLVKNADLTMLSLF